MRRLVPLSIAMALAGTTLVSASLTTAQGSAPAAGKVRTPFALNATAYGTKVTGGGVPVSSGRTAHEYLVCTNLAGKSKSNNVAGVTLPGLGTLGGVTSRVWSTKVGDTVSVYSEHTVARLTLIDSPLGDLEIRGISSTARAYHDNTGFHADVDTDVAKIVFAPPVGNPITLDLPKPGQPVVIPGLVRITVGTDQRDVNRHGARAISRALEIKVLEGTTDTTAVVGHTRAAITDGIKRGIFRGRSVGLTAKALGDLVNIGNNPVEGMPCRGTRGEDKIDKLADVTIPGVLEVTGLEVGVNGRQTKSVAVARHWARVAKVDIGNGALVIDGIRARSVLERTRTSLKRSSTGTGLGQITVNGSAVSLPPVGVLEVPGVARIEEAIVQKTKFGQIVTALRITLLDGTGAVLELGKLESTVRNSGLK